MREAKEPSILERISSAESLYDDDKKNGSKHNMCLKKRNSSDTTVHVSANMNKNVINKNGFLSDKLKIVNPKKIIRFREWERPQSTQCMRGNSSFTNKRQGSRVDLTIRPFSAPNGCLKKGRKTVILSAKDIKPVTERETLPTDEAEMFKLVEVAKETKNFKKETEEKRQDEKHDGAPVFNKRLFASQGTVIITREARRLMSVNEIANEKCDVNTILSKTEMTCLRCVTEGLKLIHKGQDFVKDVLSRVVTYEVYNAFKYVPVKEWESSLSCYYVLNGAVEVTYDLRASESRNVYQANIIYSHGTGEYVGLVSPEGPSEDLTPPATIYTKELTQFIRVDRQRFHQMMKTAIMTLDKRKKDFIASHSFLKDVAEDVKEKILHKLSIQDYAANRILLSQGDLSENLYIVMSGRCQTYREVYIPETDRTVLFYLTSREPDDIFGEECVLYKENSTCTIVTTTNTTIMKLHKSALQMVHRDRLSKHIENARHEFPDDEELQNRGYKDSMWNKFKHTQIKASLRETGKLRYLAKTESCTVQERPPDEDEQMAENMRLFVMKGSNFQPIRAQSAFVRKDRIGLPIRPQTTTAFVSQFATRASEIDEVDACNKVLPPEPQMEPKPPSPKPVKPREPEKHFLRTMESKENVLKVLEEQQDGPGLMKQAWKDENDENQASQNFMKNGVLVTMRSEDIVRKAKALADTYADKWKAKMENESTEDWDTILHTENKDAKTKIQANRLRMRDLKRRLTDLQKRRDKTRQVYQQNREKSRQKPPEPESVVFDDVTMNEKNNQKDQHIEDLKKRLVKQENDTELSDIEDIDIDTLPMYKMTNERMKLLQSWDVSDWKTVETAGSENQEYSDNT